MPSHQLDGAIHTVSGLTAGHFLKATGTTAFGFAVHGLTYSDVGADVSGAATSAVSGHESTYNHTNYNTAYGWGNWAHTTLSGYGITDACPLAHKTTEDGLTGLVSVSGGSYSAKVIGTDVQAYNASLAAIAGGTWTGATSITTLGTISTGTVPQAHVSGLTTSDSPVFATVKLSGLTDTYFPYHVADATGLADSPMYISAGNYYATGGAFFIDNNKNYCIKDFGGTPRSLLLLNTSNDTILASSAAGLGDTNINSSGVAGAMTIKATTGHVLVGTANDNASGAKLQTVDGITFPATQVTSSDVNTIDDYKEATWTPGVSFGGGTTGITYGVNTGSYTKVGNRVFFSGYIALTAKGSSTGAALITGLPFTCMNNNRAWPAVSLRLNKITYANAFQGVVNINTTTIALSEITEAGVYTVLADTDFVDTSAIMVSGHYEVA